MQPPPPCHACVHECYISPATPRSPVVVKPKRCGKKIQYCFTIKRHPPHFTYIRGGGCPSKSGQRCRGTCLPSFATRRIADGQTRVVVGSVMRAAISCHRADEGGVKGKLCTVPYNGKRLQMTLMRRACVVQRRMRRLSNVPLCRMERSFGKLSCNLDIRVLIHFGSNSAAHA